MHRWSAGPPHTSGTSRPGSRHAGHAAGAVRGIATAIALALLSSLAACADAGSGPSAEAPDGGSPRVSATIATDLEVPWGLDFLPGGDAVVTERDSGRVLRISGPDHAVTELGSLVESTPNGEGGLLGVAVSPSYGQDHTLYFYLSAESDNRVVRATVRDGRLLEPEPLLTGIPLNSYHDGGRIAFGPDGYLYVATGDAGDRDRAQDPGSLSGKILRLTPDGAPAPGNPGGTPVWSLGHRNVQGLAWVDDQLWASEFGENAYDELNRIRAGADYGWPDVEGTGGTDRGYVDPVVQWPTEEASPSGLAAAGGALWMAALRGERLWRIDPVTGDASDHFVGDHGRLRTVALAPDGTLWVTTSNRDGRGSPSSEDDRILQVSLPQDGATAR